MLDLWRTEWHWQRYLFYKYLGFPLSLLFHQCSVFILVLPLPEGQPVEAWEPSKKHCFFSEVGEHWIGQYFRFFGGGAFAKLRKATISFVTSVHPSVPVEQLGSRWADFHES